MNISKNNIYFNAEGFVLLEGDCFKLLKKIDPESIDMIFADKKYFL